jgi:hypothetical protein
MKYSIPVLANLPIESTIADLGTIKLDDIVPDLISMYETQKSYHMMYITIFIIMFILIVIMFFNINKIEKRTKSEQK